MKISIITATFNSAKTLSQTLESVLKQTYHDYEHIIVDGLSKDNTMEIVKQYEAKYNGKLKYISEKDTGIYDAMNKGIKMATGDVIGILNSDDIYANEKDMLSGNEEMCDICIYGIKLGTPMSEVIEILNEPSYKYEGEEQINYEYYDNENDGINFISYNGETVSQIDVYFYD